MAGAPDLQPYPTPQARGVRCRLTPARASLAPTGAPARPQQDQPRGSPAAVPRYVTRTSFSGGRPHPDERREAVAAVLQGSQGTLEWATQLPGVSERQDPRRRKGMISRQGCCPGEDPQGGRDEFWPRPCGHGDLPHTSPGRDSSPRFVPGLLLPL